MPSPRPGIWLIPAIFALSASVATAAVRESADPSAKIALRHDPNPAVQRELSRSAAWRAFEKRYGAWNVLWNESTRSPHRAFGRPIPLDGFSADAAGADRAVRSFIARNSEVFGESPSLTLAGAYRKGEVWYVRYRESVAGIPVLFSDWEFRLGPSGQLIAFGADVHRPSARLALQPRIGEAVAREAAQAGLALDPAAARIEGDAKLYVLPRSASGAGEDRLVYAVRARSTKPIAHWLSFVDAETGEVLLRQNRVFNAVSGTVTGTVHLTSPTQSLTTMPFKNAYVMLTTQAVTDAAGAYSQNVSGSVTVKSELRGPYVNVDRCINDLCGGGIDASFSKSTSNPSVVNIPWSGANSQDSERDAFYHVNVAHDYIKSLDPAYTANDYEMKVNVDLTDTCNSQWDGFGLNFSMAGDGCLNTASMPDIVYHEYAHSVNDNLYVANGSPFGMGNAPLQEGLSDINAALMTDDPVIGNEFMGPGTSLRTLVNTKKWPQDHNSVSAQKTGLILGGAVWEVRQAIGLATTSHLVHFAKYGLPDDPDDGVAFGEFFIEMLIADDDNANLSDGTPHSNEIVSAFNNHGIGTNYFLNISAPLEDQPNTGPFPVNATITYTGPIGGLDVTSPTLFYSVSGAPFVSQPMFPTGELDEYGALIPSKASAVIRYYIRAMDLNGGVKLDPPDAPTHCNVFLAGPFSVLYENDFESDLGWVTPGAGDDATSGLWVREAPVASAIQPGEDHSPFGTVCYVTGNTLAPGMNPGVNDVDGGKTTLTSTTFDATAGGQIRPVISYWRWFSNNGGDNPNQDPWVVEISNNGGSSWTPVENTLATDEAWRRVMFFIEDYVTPTNNMKIRFVARDDFTFPSLVESAVDDFALFAYPPSIGVSDDAPIADRFALAPASPNPFGSRTRIRYTLARRGRVDLGVFDIQGRSVRSLVGFDQDPGRHTIEWDGRDDSGRPLPNGPYFVRLAQTGQRAAEAVVLMR